MDDLFYTRLIGLVRKHPILWEKYTNFGIWTHRRQAWQAIADVLGVTADIARMRWIKLRWNYKRRLRLEMITGFASRWKFFAALDFIRDDVLESLQDSDDTEVENSEDSDFQDESDVKIEIGPTQIVVTTLQPILQTESTIEAAEENFQESHVSTPSQKHSAEVAEQTADSLGKKRKSTESPLEVTQTEHSETFQTPYNHASSSNSNTNNGIYTLAYKRLEMDQSSNLQTPLLQKDQLSENIIDLTDSFEIKPIQGVGTLLPSLLLSENRREENNFQEPHVSTCTTSKHSLVNAEKPEDPKEPENRFDTQQKKSLSAEEILRSENDVKDEDYYFALSLLPSLRKIPYNKKFDLRIAIMNLIAKAFD